ncbi:MAG: NAD(P)-dependent alcohol dehydrogenase [Bacteroidales bacterium]|nr:NAD(P)-dependent alcohol dehydrogenase [Bacteroidales bacterium]MBN2820413.1 NAD(P)-dependent alcohol dehydrogenase [Bacteroidales bacterium]
MKAVICKKYGSPEVLKLMEVEKPSPKDNEVCVKIHATAVTNSDIFIRSSKLPFPIIIPFRLMIGFFKPRKSIIGLVFSGEIESIGENTKRFKPGDKVYGLTGFNLGTYAEYMCMKENDSKKGSISFKPDNISHEEATMVAYGGILAFQYLEKGKIEKGQKVLIYGASGTTGTIAVQIAKQLGAEVTGVCSTSNLEMVKKLGADFVMDYTKQNEIPEGVNYDFMLDAVGKAKTSKLKKAGKKALSPKAKYISIDDGDLKLDSERLNEIKEYVESGYIKPVLDKCYKLEEIVEAHRYVEKGHKKGGVAITVI